MKVVSKLFFVLVVLLLCACEVFMAPPAPPFVITKPVCVIGASEPNYQCGGIEFTLYNTSNKTISGIAMSCMVYDAETEKSPFIGSNIIKATFSGLILPDESRRLILSLDDHMHTIPEDPYLLDFFYISKVMYTDGSVWEDPNGIYSTRSY